MFFELHQQRIWVLKGYLFMLKYLSANLVKEVRLRNNEVELKTTKNNLRALFLFFKKSTLCRYEQLIDIAVTDVLGKINRFSISYLLKSILYSSRLVVVVKTNEVLPVPTIIDLYSSSNWLEREVWDFYGIFFNDHNDLRRILTDYGFSGHPLRKDFPLTGFKEIYFDDSSKRMLYEDIELTQEFRVFTLETPWIKWYN